MFDNSGMIGEMLERGQSTVKNATKSAKQGAQNFARTGLGQVTGLQTPAPQQSDQGTNEQANAAAQNQQKMSDEEAKKFLQDLYGSPDKKSDPDKSKTQGTQNPQNPIAQAVGATPKNPNKGKSPEELAKIEALRQQLHGDYYQTLVNPQKPQEEPVTEKLEREGQEEKMTELETEKKKPPPIAVQKVQQSAEKFRGVSG